MAIQNNWHLNSFIAGFIQSFFFVFVINNVASFALPGFVYQLKTLHPEKEISCATCHTRGDTLDYNNDNVNVDGRKYYQELRTQKQKPISFSSLFRVDKSDFIVFGDSRTQLGIHKQVIDKIKQDNPKALVFTGDFVNNGATTSEWNAILPFYDFFINKKNLYPACGNHEGAHCLNNPLRKKMGNTEAYYTFDLAPFTFIALDSYHVTAEQLKWLSNLPADKLYIPFYHHVPYPTIAGHSAEKVVLNEFIPRFKKLGVKLSFNGHNHGYDRALQDDITYVTAGGGGAPLYPCGANKKYTKVCYSDYHYVKCSVSGRTISCAALLLSGQVVDAFAVEY